uniref:Secreted protein n=1 Tax=Steinernema glaseri TaxID=37863 RepID=A0A1I7YWZ8_9BILA
MKTLLVVLLVRRWKRVHLECVLQVLSVSFLHSAPIADENAVFPLVELQDTTPEVPTEGPSTEEKDTLEGYPWFPHVRFG